MFRNTTAEDVAYVVEHMRPEDVREWWLSSGKPAAQAIAELGEKPYVSFTLTKGDEPVAIFGATIDAATGVATMFRFATKRWPEVVREAIKIGRRVVLPLFKEAGVKKLQAFPTYDSDTRWLAMFGAEWVGNRLDCKTKCFVLPLAA